MRIKDDHFIRNCISFFKSSEKEVTLKMKLIILFLTVSLMALLVSANIGSDERITDEEIQELINAYKSNDGKSAAVNPKEN